MGPRIQNLTLKFKVPTLGYLPIKFGTDPWKNEGGVAFFVFFTFFTLAAKPVDLLTPKKVICQATAHGHVISQPKHPSITGKLPKVRDRQQQQQTTTDVGQHEWFPKQSTVHRGC